MLKVTHVLGPLIIAEVLAENGKIQESPKMLETVYIGSKKLLGEIISIETNSLKIQVFEETAGLQVGEEVWLSGQLLSVELGPGMLGEMFDGIQRPLKKIEEISPIFIQPGINIPALDRDKEWDFIPTVQLKEEVTHGQKLGYVQETPLLKHWLIAPSLDSDETWIVEKITAGSFKVWDIVAVLKSNKGSKKELTLASKWPVKVPRSVAKKLEAKKIFKTGQRVIDSFFPILLGGKVSTPGPFGAGKTFTQQQIAKWSDAEVVVYVGCGERGNEMTEMVKLFPTLIDPKTDRPLMERTVLIANTSNMPLAAREASIYTGITIAEYFRDMGLNVVLMADSTSRWAEALREISQRLGEMPSEEGYPAYLGSRIAAFYERAGVTKNFDGEEGSVTVIGTVSPPGGDFSEPMTQNSLKNSQVFLALDAGLAMKRHYPAINWQTSYSLFEENYAKILNATLPVGDNYLENRLLAKQILASENQLLEIVKLVGPDGLDNEKRLILEIAKSLREDYLQQNGFDEIDTYCSFEKMEAMLSVIINLYNKVNLLLEQKNDNENLVAEIFNPEMQSILTNLKYQTNFQDVLEFGNKTLEILKKYA
jgi:V/A-type H+-transporting ATPase subunit A